MAYDNKSCRCVIASVHVDKTQVTVAEKEIDLLASGYNTSVRVVKLILILQLISTLVTFVASS